MQLPPHALTPADVDAVRFIRPREISTSSDFQFRQTSIYDWHVRDLARLVREMGELDPILLWQETDAEGQETGRLVLLDGNHRLNAYATARGTDAVIPATIIKGTPQQAATRAGKANSRVSIALNNQERTNGAWRTVCLPGKRASIPEIARSWGVAARTVGNMRKRLSVMREAGSEPTGDWSRDRVDELPDREEQSEMTDEARNALIVDAGEKLRQAMGKLTLQDETIAAEALNYAFGPVRLRSMTDYLFAERDEFADEHEDLRTPDTDDAF
ncbi:ParB-like nuclease family protein [Rhodobacter aestuarii]|uniref:ParB-like nuclease domain-containing protein n=1 Tax=Rhodobacter aestuarii TaxID=453582 RepID=A0A1N7JQL6_9RHOB|nr:hypothetical protein [Rhodobacter aestuarii]PTV96028.1 ParB-like nuclease family protein [Rhodobacter aestuarii]SIS51652.1 ParB-like nuclease domain-containing protein [Rhodobacter aestuarii]